MRYVMIAAMMAIHVIMISVMAWVFQEVNPQLSDDGALIWALAIFVAAWRVSEDIKKD